MADPAWPDCFLQSRSVCGQAHAPASLLCQEAAGRAGLGWVAAGPGSDLSVQQTLMARDHADVRPVRGYGSIVPESPKIVTHPDPVGRSRTNNIQRIAIDVPAADRFEQIWTYTEDQHVFELCCIPFFPYGVSLGDRITIAEDGSFVVVEKSGHQTIRVVIHDVVYAHEHHVEFHDLIVGAGARAETFGHATYWALDVDDPAHAQRVIEALAPLSEARILDWERADPPV